MRHPERMPSPPTLEHEHETLMGMQIDHFSQLYQAGTVGRALGVGGDHRRGRIGPEPMAYIATYHDTRHQIWYTAIQFPHYALDRQVDPNAAGWSTIPVCVETDSGDLQLVEDGFTPDDAELVTTLRQELVDARDIGMLPDLSSDLTHIAARIERS